jgi:hypothetical protein
MVAVLGGTGSGKTWRVMKVHLKPKPARLLILDFKRDPTFAGYADVVTAQQLVVAVQRPKFAVRYQPAFDAKIRAKEFDWLCSLAYHVGNLTLWVEELAKFTRGGHPPGPWSAITTTGREYSVGGKVKHLDVIATSQRTVGLDGDFLSNCTAIECGVLEYPRDQETIAEYLRCQPEQLQLLQPGEFVQRRRGETIFKKVGKAF